MSTLLQKPQKPLSGIRVVDFTIMMAGPYCARYLADLGAEVVKIEPPEGEYIRSRAPLRPASNGDGSLHSAYYAHLNCGKKSAIFDLKQPEDLSQVRSLVAEADVLVENFRPGVMQRFGLDYAAVAAFNSKLIYCSISGFGQTGPGAARPAYAQIVQAMSGYDLGFMRFQPEQKRPANTVLYPADVLAGTYGFSAVLTALYQRDRIGGTGRGQALDVSLMEGMLNLMPFEVQEAQWPDVPKRAAFRPLRTSDGFVMLGLVSVKNFEDLFVAIGHAEWAQHPRFGTQAGRLANWDEVMNAIETWTETRSADDCEAYLSERGVACAKYQTVAQALQDPQLIHRGNLAPVIDGAGETRVPSLPFQMSDADVRPGNWVARTGADKEAVLKAWLSK